MFNLAIGLGFACGLALFGLIITGVYTLFADSFGMGLMMIGGAVVGGWILTLVGGLFMVAGKASMRASINGIEDRKPTSMPKSPAKRVP